MKNNIKTVCVYNNEDAYCVISAGIVRKYFTENNPINKIGGFILKDLDMTDSPIDFIGVDSFAHTISCDDLLYYDKIILIGIPSNYFNINGVIRFNNLVGEKIIVSTWNHFFGDRMPEMIKYFNDLYDDKCSDSRKAEAHYYKLGLIARIDNCADACDFLMYKDNDDEDNCLHYTIDEGRGIDMYLNSRFKQ